MTLPFSPSMTGLYDSFSPLADEPDCDITEDEAMAAFIDAYLDDADEEVVP